MYEGFHLLYPQGYDISSSEPMKNFEFIEALEIDDMVVIARESFRGFQDLSLEKFFSTDPAVLDYRLSIVEDLVENPALYGIFCKSIPVIRNIHDLWKNMTRDFTVESALSAIRYLEMYQEIVDLFAKGLENLELRSEGMKQFYHRIHSIVNSEDYRNLSTELSKMEIQFGQIKAITIGVNLDEMLQPKEAGILSIEETHFKSGTLIDRLLRKKSKNDHTLMTPLYPLSRGLDGIELQSLNLSIQSAIQKIFTRCLREFEPLIQKYYSVNTSFFISLLDDIRFLTAGVNFILSMKEKGFPMCRPSIAAMADKKCDLEDVYNPFLAQSEIEDKIVSNTFTLDENGRFYLVTGPNHGGKSIFAYAIGMAQALFQLGLFVPAKSALMSPVSNIYTHFPSSDENNYGKGRLESECSRLGEIMKKLTDTDMLLMDESFSSTSGLEAGYIASEVLTGIGIIGCCGLFVTHIHDLPQQVKTYNSHPDNRGKIDNLVAMMENKENGTRSYKICRTTPDGLSYARDIASRYGLNLEGILAGK